MADSGMARPDTVITVGLSPSGDMGPGSGDWAQPPRGANVPATKKSALHPSPRLRALLTRPATLPLLVLTFVFRFPFHRLAHPIEHRARPCPTCQAPTCAYRRRRGLYRGPWGTRRG